MTIHIRQGLQALLNVPDLPCEEAADWAQGKTIQEIWNTCERGDWLLWWAQKSGLESRKLTATKAACAEFARPYMKDARSIAALDMAHAYGRGECSADDLAAAASAAAYAYAYAAAAADAAYAAAYAAAASTSPAASSTSLAASPHPYELSTLMHTADAHTNRSLSAALMSAPRCMSARWFHRYRRRR